jgi:hypothetical protein
MRRFAAPALALLLACCGGDGGNGPSAANVEGTWIITFTSNVGSSCSVSQISLILLADGASPHEGSYGSSAITCTGQAQISEPTGFIVAYQVSGKNVSIQFTNNPNRSLSGSVNGATITGTFAWNSTYSISGTFIAVKQ